MITWGRRAISSILEVHAEAWCRPSRIHRHHRLPARLSRCVHARCDGARRPRHEDRRIDGQPHHQRLHLRQGAPLPRARLRRRSAALSGRPARRQGRGAVQARDLGRCARADRGEVRGGARRRRRGDDSSALLRRLERIPHAGLRRRDPVPSLRHVAPAAHGVRGADRRGQPRASTARWRRSATRTIPTRR